MDIWLSSQETEQTTYNWPQNVPGVLRVRQEAALFVEGDVTDKDQQDPTNAGVACNSALTGSEQFAGSIAGGLSSLPSRASDLSA